MISAPYSAMMEAAGARLPAASSGACERCFSEGRSLFYVPISEKFNDYAQKLSDLLNNSDIRTVLDDRNEKIGRKIRDNELKKIPYLLIVGENEMKDHTVSVRRQGQGDMGIMPVEEFIKKINEEVNSQLETIYSY